MRNWRENKVHHLPKIFSNFQEQYTQFKGFCVNVIGNRFSFQHTYEFYLSGFGGSVQAINFANVPAIVYT